MILKNSLFRTIFLSFLVLKEYEKIVINRIDAIGWTFGFKEFVYSKVLDRIFTCRFGPQCQPNSI